VHVVDGLPAPLRDRCTVDRRRHHPTDLMTQLSTCDVVISMRLHGCLLAMIAGTPAMGLAYESKTPEINSSVDLRRGAVEGPRVISEERNDEGRRHWPPAATAVAMVAT
jgi:polysaccharide pyruvyl transferase WcaK-like protein